MQMATCEQCYRAYWRKRSTKTTCSDACRKSKSRGNAPSPYWEVDTMTDKYEDFIAVLYQHRPVAVVRLQQIRDRYGRNAMLAAIDTIHIVLKDGGITL